MDALNRHVAAYRSKTPHAGQLVVLSSPRFSPNINRLESLLLVTDGRWPVYDEMPGDIGGIEFAQGANEKTHFHANYPMSVEPANEEDLQSVVDFLATQHHIPSDDTYQRTLLRFALLEYMDVTAKRASIIGSPRYWRVDVKTHKFSEQKPSLTSRQCELEERIFPYLRRPEPKSDWITT